MNQLKSEIKSLRRRNTSRHWYFPESLVLKLLTEESIGHALIESPSFQREEIVRNVFQRGRKIFCILLLVDQVAQVTKFIEGDHLEDERLPFHEQVLVQDMRLEKDTAQDFYEKQWELIAPTFRRGTLNRRFGESIILAFREDRNIGQGSFGKVYETAIDSDHQELGQLFPEKFARKEFSIGRFDPRDNRSTLNHKKELANLALLNHLKHPHIVELLCSYTYDDSHNLLFELADSGNLAGVLGTERLARFASDETLFIALAGLSSAVEHVHDFSERKIDLDLIGCHHDLRPRNILVSGSKFILADFGLSTFKDLSQNSGTPFKVVSDDYLAPECEDWGNKFQAGTVHRSSDIWSFGCILAEVATYMTYGHEGVDRFRQAREYRIRSFLLYHFHEGPERESSAVNDWLAKLEISSTRTCALLVRIVRQTLLMNQAERPKAKEVTWWLRFVSFYEIAATVNHLFCQIQDDDDSLDIFLERIRFDSWRYALGILKPEDNLSRPHISSYDEMSQFDTILGSLTRLRADLKTRLSREKPTQRLDISQLLKLNDELHCFLSQEKKELSREYFNITVMEKEGELFEQIENRTASGSLSHEIRMRANVQHMNNLLVRDSSADIRAMQIDHKSIELRNRFGDHHLGFSNDSKAPRLVWVEWRKYGQHGVDEHVMERLYERTARITSLLSEEKPATFRTLECSGFFNDPSRTAFGLVFDIPWFPGSLEATSLDQVLEVSTDRSSLWPDLDDRFALASSIAASLLEVHSVGWFHKGLNTSNVMFFSEAGGVDHRSIVSPFLVGFNHSRPDEPLGLTSGLSVSALRHYQHPVYLKDGFGFQPEFDYYSLGIILLEIGFWSPIRNLTKGWTGSYEEKRQRLLNDRVPQLRQRMGKEYFEAVNCCIRCEFGESESGSTKRKDLILTFGERVVARLRGCSI
ncbi:kinase-like protein [Lophiostoma macrostomum CBS 122681]|uniref:Kinase-like protein n=1 Tax=Lophiostoma macrostomum CBS 122681 TaxID=1314788 RepID=A0A6A6SV36_9PLEO|nr:kinase-like protein [Lophiostoma macrostomum CBS 122681]